MSGLAAVLAGRHPAGVFTWHAAFEAADVQHAVETAGWALGHVDGWRAGLETKGGFLTEVGVALSFPDHYGRNLDALADCLADLDCDTVLLWDGWSTLARADEKAFRPCLEVLRERAGSTGPDVAARFVALLRGEGPALDVPPLDPR